MQMTKGASGARLLLGARGGAGTPEPPDKMRVTGRFGRGAMAMEVGRSTTASSGGAASGVEGAVAVGAARGVVEGEGTGARGRGRGPARRHRATATGPAPLRSGSGGGRDEGVRGDRSRSRGIGGGSGASGGIRVSVGWGVKGVCGGAGWAVGWAGPFGQLRRAGPLGPVRGGVLFPFFVCSVFYLLLFCFYFILVFFFL